MESPARSPAWQRYAASLILVATASIVTTTIPILRDRFTFFLYWPLVLGIGWYYGAGPAILATALSALAVLAQLAPDDVGRSAYVVTAAVFSLIGLTSAALARWRQQAEAVLGESRRRFATVANAAPVLIWLSGPDKRFTWFNQAWLDFTGRSLERETGEGWLEAVHPDDRAGVREIVAKAAETGESFEIEFRLRRADGEYRHVLDRGVARRGADGRLLGFIGSCTDITEQREALREAERAREAAETSSRAKDAFLATVSHELRAPLSPIITWVQMLRDERLTPEQTRSALTVIDRNARMQAQLIEDLLDVARIVEGKLRLQVRPVLLADVVQHAIDTIRPAAEAKNIRLQVVLDTTVAPIPGDPDRLQQVFWNLLSNAVKFTDKGGRVHVVLERVNSHVEICVSDTGAGIGAAQLPHLFERFWQGDSSTTKAYAGLGLGLAIVRHLVELHGGTVVAESPGEGQGSTFTVKLPVVPVAKAAGEEMRRHPVLRDGTIEAPVRLDGIRVLLVDDEPDSNEALRILLDRCGAEVRVAGNVTLALEVLARWTPDLLVTDIGMPGQDGYSLLRKVRERPDKPFLPAIALTAYASREDHARLLQAGFQLHLVKPAESHELTAAIAAVAKRQP